MASIFCDSDGTLFVEFLKVAATVSSELWVKTFKEVKTSNSNVSDEQEDESR
jgi:hypothetical protein